MENSVSAYDSIHVAGQQENCHGKHAKLRWHDDTRWGKSAPRCVAREQAPLREEGLFAHMLSYSAQFGPTYCQNVLAEFQAASSMQ